MMMKAEHKFSGDMERNTKYEIPNLYIKSWVLNKDIIFLWEINSSEYCMWMIRLYYISLAMDI